MNTHRGFASILVALVAGLGIAACGAESTEEPDQAQAVEADDTVAEEIQTSDPQEGGEVVRDHRQGPGAVVRDHRGEGGEVRDHRGGPGGAPGGVVVRDHRGRYEHGYGGYYHGQRPYGGERRPYWQGRGWRRSERMERHCRGIGWNRAVCEFQRERKVCVPFVGCFERIF